jgi:hypothetical protein
MAWAGYLFATDGLNIALLASIIPGVTIEMAYAMFRRADRAAGRRTASGRARFAQEAVGLSAGGLMAVGGYAGATWGRLLAAPFLLSGLPVIAAAVLLGRSDELINPAEKGANPVKIHPGRYTADNPSDFVVFLIGMRFNHPLKIHKWLPVASAMPRMLRVLDDHRELGCLGYRQWFGRTTGMIQYWKDFESLDRFARDQALPHLEPWRKFNRAVRNSGDVGIWHETYRVRAGEYEAIYGNMPVFGLAAATRHVPVAAKANTAAVRIGARVDDEPAVTPY